MADLAGYMDDLQAFVAFANLICDPLFFSYYQFSPEKVSEICDVFMEILNENLPDVAKHFLKEGIQPQLYLIEWFMTLFSKYFGYRKCPRVWDYAFYDGTVSYFKLAIGKELSSLK